MRKVLPFVGFSAVVWPVIVPSLADQNLVLPSQPVRSWPLKRGTKPSASASARTFLAAGEALASGLGSSAARTISDTDPTPTATAAVRASIFVRVSMGGSP